MSAVERYVGEVLSYIHAPTTQKKRLEEDLRNHFEEALKGNESPQEIVRKLGKPEDVAHSFMGEIPLHYAGFWSRTGAFLLDILFCLNLTVPFLLLLFAVFGFDGGEMKPFVFVLLLLFGLGAAGVFLLYFPLLETRFGQTLGKRLFHLWVIAESGQPIGMGQAILRRLSTFFDFLWLDALFIPFTEKKQRALDIVARTVVTRDRGSEVAWLAIFLMIALAFTLSLMTAAFLIFEKAG